MVNDRFIQLLTNELCDALTDAEREELQQLLRDNKELRDQKEILKTYWERHTGQYEASAALFKKVVDKIRISTPPAGQPETLPLHSVLSPGEEPAPVEFNTGYDPEYPLEFQSPRRRARTAWYWAAAVLLIAAGILFSRKDHPATGTRDVATLHWLQQTTHPTEKSIITLPDGTRITLNSATALRYPESFGDSIREVYLNGEAFFDVARDPIHPFIIHADKMNIRVLGTSFNVKSYQGESLSEATLINGSIEVTLNDRPSDRIILKPKEKLVVQDNLALKKPADIPDDKPASTGKSTRYSLTNLTIYPNPDKTVIETSWVENKLVFSDKEFSQLSGQLERWYGVHIQFANEKVKEYRFTGFFEKETLSQALDALKMIEHFRYKIADSTVLIY